MSAQDAADADRPDRPSLAERVRAWTDGSLPPDGAARLQREAATSESVAAFADAWRAVDAALREAEDAAVADAGPCRVRFADVEGRIAHDAVPTRAALRLPVHAAAAVVLAAIVAAGLFAAGRPDARLTLAAIPAPHAAAARETAAPEASAALRAADAIAALDDVPAPWFSDLAAARDAARATGRPLLVFVQHPTCPICEELEAGPLRDEAVCARIARCAAVRVGAFEESDDPVLDRDWPYLGVFSPTGREVADLPAPCTAGEMGRLLDDAVARAGAAAPVPWSRVRALAARLVEGREARDDGRPDREWSALAEVASAADGGAFADAARGLLAERADEAAAALDDAASAAASDPAEAVRRLAAAAQRFAGTPWGDDLAAVRAAVLRDGRFPALVRAAR